METKIHEGVILMRRKDNDWFNEAKKMQPQMTKILYEQGFSLSDAKKAGKDLSLIGAAFGSAWEKTVLKNEIRKRRTK